MKSADNRLADYLGHIVQAIDRIQRYIADSTEATFRGDLMVQDAVLRNLEVVGEASRKIAVAFPAFVREHPDLPFNAAYQMRNALAHGYFKVDLDIVWRTVRRDLPALRVRVAQALDELPPG